MLSLQKIRAYLLTATPKILSTLNNHSPGYYCTESKSPIGQEYINNNVEEDTVFEVYDEHWEVNPIVEQVHISPKMRPEENLSFIRMKNLFDIPELVEALKRENIRDIVCLNVDRNFLAPYMVIGNGVSKRHIQNTVVRIHKLILICGKVGRPAVVRRKLYKRNKCLVDILGQIAGLTHVLGTIFLHLFLPSTRLKYDLESLWCAGPQYDDQLFQKNTAELPNRNFNWEQLLSEIQQAKQC